MKISAAAWSQRFEPKGELDFFPTPLWATRALIEHVLGSENIVGASCLEPACGSGHMVSALSEYFDYLDGFDIKDYESPHQIEKRDFLTFPYENNSYDWVITNPPFNKADLFILRALDIARQGVAVLCRTAFLESKGRFEKLFLPHPLSQVAQFVERVPMVKGRLDQKAVSATSYAWFVWRKNRYSNLPPQISWIPPCRKALERPGDYQD